MKQCILLLILGSFVIISCQKEIDFEFKNENIPLDTSRLLLLKMVTRLIGDPDSTVTSFKYDNAKRLVEYDVKGSPQGFIYENYKLIRNSTGNIFKVIATIDDPSLSGIVTTTYTFFYDASGLNYKYRIGNSVGQGINFKDSTVYQYDVNNKITQQRVYEIYPGILPFEVRRRNFVYDGNNNLVEATSYTDFLGAGILDLDVVSTFGYDSNSNPLQFRNETIVTGPYLLGIPSENNIKREIIQFPQDPQRNEVRDHTYTYNSAGYPVTDLSTIEGSIQQVTFYYQ